MSRWIICEQAGVEETFWNVMRQGADGKYYLAAHCPLRADAEFLLGAAKWADSLGMSLLSLSIHGITFDAEGKPVPVPKTRTRAAKPTPKRRTK